MTIPSPSRTLAALVVTLLFAEALAGRQEPLPGFADIIDVRVVNLEVVVTDRQGNRVAGLGPEDFRLLVDGEATDIAYFTEIEEGRVKAADGEGAPAEIGETVPTNYLLFVDDYFAIQRDRDRVLEAVGAQLEALGPQDRVAAVAFDGSELTLLTGWTREREAVAGALERARARRTFGLQRLAELRSNDAERKERQDQQLLSIEQMRRTGGALPEQNFMRISLDPVEMEYATRLGTQVEHSILAAVSAMRSFAGPPGRKVMLLLSGGWPISPGEYTINDFRSDIIDASAGSFDPRLPSRGDLLEPLVSTANLLGFTLYPVDVPGQRRTIAVGADQGFNDFERQGETAGTGGETVDRELLVHASLDYLAGRTGGRSLTNAERDRALAIVADDTRTYYWLGFSPVRREDDAPHAIEIQLPNHPDLRVRARQGFVDLSRSKEVSLMVESSLLFGDPPTTKPLLLRFGSPERGFRKMTVPLEVGMSMDEITVVPQNGRWVNQVEVQVVVMDENGSRSSTSVETVPINGAAPPQPGQSFWYETELTLRARDHRIVVAVYDPLSGAILSSSGEITAR